MKDNEITDERAKRVAAARRRLARLKLASVTASVIGFGALSGSIAAATPMVATANTAASTSTASAPSSNSSAAASTGTATTTGSTTTTGTPTVPQPAAPIVSAQS